MGVRTKPQIYPFVLNVYYLQCDKIYTICVKVPFHLKNHNIYNYNYQLHLILIKIFFNFNILDVKLY